MALYNATDGPNWTNQTNLGVTTNTQGQVTHLNLHNNQLSGPLPAEIGNLTNLTTLHLNDKAHDVWQTSSSAGDIPTREDADFPGLLEEAGL